jgi:hypothetical protein
LLSSNSGMIPSFYQTGPGDLSGSSWDAAEGQQNFAELDNPYYGDSEDLTFPFTQATPNQDQTDASDDLKWTPSTGVVDMKMLKSEPMRRMTSKSSTGSNKHRAGLTTASKKTRQRMHSPLLTRAPSQYPNLDLTGNASVSAYHHQEATIGHGRMMDPQQYLAHDLDTLSVSSHISVSSHMNMAQAFNPRLMALADGLSYPEMGLGFSMTNQHVNPTATQIFDTSHSPQSWGSLSPETRTTSPGAADDAWSGPLVASPTETQDSPPMLGPSPR